MRESVDDASRRDGSAVPSAGTEPHPAHPAHSAGRHRAAGAEGTDETGPAGARAAGGGRGAAHGRATGDSDDFEPLRLRPYVSLPDAADGHTQASQAPAAAESDGGLLGPGGPFRWSLVEEIWGPNERVSRGSDGSTDSPAAGSAAARKHSAGSVSAASTEGSQGYRGPTGQPTPPGAAQPSGEAAGAGQAEGAGPSTGDEPERPVDPAAPTWPGRPDGPRLNAPQPDEPAPHPPDGADTASFATTRGADFFGTQHPFRGSQTPDDDGLTGGATAVGDVPRPGGVPRAGSFFDTDAAAGADATFGRKAADDADGHRPVPDGPVSHPAAGPAGRTRSLAADDHARADGSRGAGRGATASEGTVTASYDPYDPYGPDDDPDDPDSAGPDDPTSPEARRRRLGLVAATGLAVAVTAVALIVSGVFHHDQPAQDNARSGSGTGTGTSAPEQPDTVTSSSKPEADAPPVPRQPSAPSTEGGAGRAPGSGQDRTAVPPPPPPPVSPTAGGSGSAGGSAPPAHRPPAPPVLHPGDKSGDVKELQLRLRQLLLYLGIADGEYNGGVETAVGNYQESRGITGDEHGVYGPSTRHSLESETRKP